MMDKDINNRTFSHSVSVISSPSGKKFFREKFYPKIEMIKEHFSSEWYKLHILDVGIGYGGFLSFLEENGFKYLYGMDPFPESLEMSKQFTRAVLKRGRIEEPEWPFPEGLFDVITSFDVVEHLEHPEDFFVNARKYLKPGGIIIFSTPNKQFPYYLRSVPGIGIPDNNPTHINVHPPKYWIQLVEINGYRTLKKWKGEHLTHIKFIPDVLKRICKFFGKDHRDVPFINLFEQSFCMVIQPQNVYGGK